MYFKFEFLSIHEYCCFGFFEKWCIMLTQKRTESASDSMRAVAREIVS